MAKGKVLDVLASVAPTLAAAMGGPLAGVAAQAITGKLSSNAVPDASVVEKLIGSASSDDLVSLKELELDFAAKMEQAGVDLASVDAADRASARQRAVQMKDRTPAVLGCLIVLGFFGILGYILGYGLPEAGSEVLMIMLGSLGTISTQVANYFFGSSMGSKTKDITIADLKGGIA